MRGHNIQALARHDIHQTTVGICGDADDLYFHGDELVVVCGSGVIELIDNVEAHGKVAATTQRGARIGVFSPAGKVLFVAVPAGETSAAIWELSYR